MGTEHFEVGDVVWLKSGGPAMTVATDAGTFVTCMWFDSEGHVHSERFPASLITEAPPSPSKQA